ncbi:TraL protein [Geothermobacter ehrlichii]|uniref:TraL protein n=1 Tax=Geothermobacter ehrlichii TaxID=213224 RepID=A0A5D3WJN0_9BACT|nr:type IV conjugative transfer system protein TraL [Geothermobacter ehrlichii]TYO96794.1 TraL protein [Geothermobacter ehrlichii]
MNDSLSRRMPQYLTQPYQLLWFEPDDMAIMAIAYLFAMIFGGWFWWSMLIVLPTIYSRAKRNRPRGFMRHLLYMLGWSRMQGYPQYFVDEFIE